MEKGRKKKEVKIKNQKNKKGEAKGHCQDSNSKIEELLALNEKYLNNWRKVEADFANYKKEEGDRIQNHIKYNQEKIILDFLSILDNIALAEEHIPEDLKENQWVIGVMQIRGQINKMLEQYNVQKIKSLGEMVNFNFHEVLQEVETNDQKNGIIITEVQEGYTMNNKVIRPAKVIIAKQTKNPQN